MTTLAGSGRLFVISGPSGSGKSTLARRLAAHPALDARLSVSATTRTPRPGEEEGREYFFLSRDAFESAAARGEFLEWAEVHGNLYGTPTAPVLESLAAGGCVILEIDVQGGLQVREAGADAVLVFVDAPSEEALEARLRTRSTESDRTIRMRLDNARGEREAISRYDVHLINDDLERAVAAMVASMAEHGCGR